jgi:hypothetical protein
MDMWGPFIASTVAHVPGGRSKIVFDRFHVMKHMTEAVDRVRKAEHRRLQGDGDETLKRTKYLWLYSEENVPEAAREKFAALRTLNLKTGRAWAIKESLRGLWRYRRRGWALRHWKHWYFWATHSRLKPVVGVARMIRGHLDNVLTYFDHRITNAVSEGLNSKIQTVKKTPMASAIAIISRRPSSSIAEDWTSTPLRSRKTPDSPGPRAVTWAYIQRDRTHSKVRRATFMTIGQVLRGCARPPDLVYRPPYPGR